MTVYCLWLCRRLNAVFLVDSVEVVKECPFCPDEPPAIDEDTGKPYADHFEDGHVSRVFAERLLRQPTQ